MIGGVDWFFHRNGLQKYASLSELKYQLTYRDVLELHHALDATEMAQFVSESVFRKEMEKVKR